MTDFSRIFGNSHPVEVDLGCGKGGFTLALSQRFPSTNFLGVDYVDRWLRKGVLPEEKKIQLNLAFLKIESLNFVTTCPDESVAVFYVQFPDPWPKRRHRRRRVFEPKFLGELYRALSPNGFLHVATDDHDYFSAMKAVVDASTINWRSVRVSVNQRIAHPELKTLYEAKFSAMGKALHYMELIK